MSKPEVLPCPFCGAEPLERAIEPHTHGGVLKALGVPDHPGSHVIECGCGAGMIAEEKQAVRDMWNRRDTYTYQEARIAELEKVLEEAAYRIDQHKVWVGMGYEYTGVPGFEQRIISNKLRAALSQQGKEGET